MPAISPARLKKDVAQLFERLDDLESFEQELERLMAFYADRTIRPSQAGMPASLLPAYHVPKPVLRELQIGLSRFADENPDRALKLAHKLWIQGYYETMILGVRLLDELPEQFSQVALRNLKSWAQSVADDDLLNEIFRSAARRDIGETLGFIETLLEANIPELNRRALVGLTEMTRSAPGAAMPGIYKLTGLALQKQPSGSRAATLILVQSQAKRAPAETAFFMRQQYLVSMRPEIGRLLRQCLSYFPDEIRSDLRRMLRENKV